MGEEKGGLYFLQGQTPSSATSQGPSGLKSVSISVSISSANKTVTNRSSNLDMWHYRLGHPSYSNFNFLQDCIPNALSNNMSHSCIDHCNVCPIAKQKHLPFPKHNKIHSTIFALVRYDV